MQQLNISGGTKEGDSLEFLREHEPEEGYFLGFSGGKDSIVMHDLAVRSGVKFQAYYSAVGIDPPEVVRYIRRHYPDVIWKYPEKSFLKLLKKKGYPTKFARWCCDYLKKRPTKDVPLKIRLMGVRAEESSKRAKRGATNQYGKNTILHPIFHWKEWEVWEYIERRGLPYCSLYDEGFGRIGCVVCPFLCRSNQTALNLHRDRWPGIYRAFEKAMSELWLERLSKREKPYLEKTPEEFISNWYRGFMPKPGDKDDEDLWKL